MGLLDLDTPYMDEEISRPYTPRTEAEKAQSGYDQTMSRARDIGEETTGPLMAAMAKQRTVKREQMGTIELTPEQQSERGKRRFYGFLAGMQKGGLGGALLGMSEVPRAYEDSMKYNNYLDKRMKDPSLTTEQRDALHARRYAGEKYSGTSRPWWSQSGRGTNSSIWVPHPEEAGQEVLMNRFSGTGELSPVIVDGKQPQRARHRDPSDAAGERQRKTSRRKFDAAMDWWNNLSAKRKQTLLSWLDDASMANPESWKVESPDYKNLTTLRDGYMGMTPEQQQQHLGWMRQSAVTEPKEKTHKREEIDTSGIRQGVQAIDDALAAQAGG
jgi:hypothetical protein